MKSYFASTFSAKGILSEIPIGNDSFHLLAVYGVPESAVTVLLDDLMHDLLFHDIPVKAYLSCIYPDTPDILIIPSLKQVILNSNYLTPLFNLLSHTHFEEPKDQHFSIEKIDMTKFCNRDLLEHYQNPTNELKEKIDFYQQEGYYFLNQLNSLNHSSTLTEEMLLLFQSIFPVSAENTGEPKKILASSITSSGWLSNLQEITTSMKRRYILNGSTAFLNTFFKLAESRAYNLKMQCHLIIDPLIPNQVEGILFPNEQQAILAQNERHGLIMSTNDISLYFDHDQEAAMDLKEFEQTLSLAVNAFYKAHSYRKELDEYYWHTLDLNQLFSIRREIMHQLLAQCDGQELWQYFL